MPRPHTTPTGGFDQFRGIYLKRIPTYSFPLMLDYAAEMGVTAEQLLHNTSLDRRELEQDGTLISFLQALKFLRRLISLCPQPQLGLSIGSRYQINTYGVLGYAMMSCPTWGEALQTASKYHRAASSLVHLELLPDQGTSNIVSLRAQAFYPDLHDIEPFTVEKVFASLIAVSKPLLETPAYPCSVSFAYPAPAYADEYERIFRCPVHFAAPANLFEWDREVMARALHGANAVSAEMGRKLCQQFTEQYRAQQDSLTQKISDLLVRSPGSIPDMEEVAARLHVSSRTLRRGLHKENITFQAIADQIRHDMAKHYLRYSALGLDEIAQLTGFTETTNFRRAFKRWQGQPPARYRRQGLG